MKICNIMRHLHSKQNSIYNAYYFQHFRVSIRNKLLTPRLSIDLSWICLKSWRELNSTIRYATKRFIITHGIVIFKVFGINIDIKLGTILRTRNLILLTISDAISIHFTGIRFRCVTNETISQDFKQNRHCI